MRKKRVLFVCTGNVDRSPTAEEMFGNIEGIETRSAGTSIAATNRITKELIEWADIIFVMEDIHEQALIRTDGSSRDKIIVLNVPDIFYKDQPELKQLLQERMRPYARAMYLSHI